jgi:hypothetical protein
MPPTTASVAPPALGRLRYPRVAGSIFADKLFGSAALFASETDEAWLAVANFMRGQSHDGAHSEGTPGLRWCAAGTRHRAKQVDGGSALFELLSVLR